MSHQTPLDTLMSRLELALVEPDPDYDSYEDEDYTRHQASSSSSCEGCVESQDQLEPGEDIRSHRQERTVTSPTIPHHRTMELGLSKKLPNGGSSHQQQDDDDDVKKPTLKSVLMRKLKDSSASANPSNSKLKQQKILEQLTVDSLPQSLVVKYLGHRNCRGLWGIQYTRDAVDKLVSELRLLNKDTVAVDSGNDLPLVCVAVTDEGISIELDSRNRSRRPLSDVGLLPLQFISYAVQDTRYSRVFAFILVREISSRSRSTECHAFLCDTPSAARTLALSVALAFRSCEARLAGQPFRFVVDLRWPDELETELNNDRRTNTSDFEV